MKSKYLIKVIASSLMFPFMLFLCAHKMNYFQGWLFLSLNLLSGFMNYWTIRNNEALMRERSTIGSNAKKWDIQILRSFFILYLINVMVAGYDSGRYQWSPNFGWGYYLIGILLFILGQIIFLTARSQNTFFSTMVRIQTDREHTVCSTGLYSIVRHPGYLGMILSLFSFPFITGSLWSFIPTTLGIVLVVIRTNLEDKTLLNELEGYRAYAEKTKNKLIPNIW